MKFSTRLICLIACSLSCVQHVQAQLGCLFNMTTNYSSYSTVSTDGTHIFTSVVTDGSASCISSPTCPCSTATHKPLAYNKLGSVGGWGYGTPGCVNCYLSYTNNQSIVATPGVVYPFTSAGEVDCSLAGTLFYTSTPTEYEATHPNCGGTSGKLLKIFAPPQTATCNGSTTYAAGISIFGSGINYVTSTSASATSDNVLVLDTIGSPFVNTLCQSPDRCYTENYKIYNVQPRAANIQWEVNIFCGAKLNPDIDQLLKQPVKCR